MAELMDLNNERANMNKKIGQVLLVLDRTSEIIVEQKLKNDLAYELEAKLRFRRQNYILIRKQAVIKEEIQRKNDEIFKTLMAQENEVNELDKLVDEIPNVCVVGLKRLKAIDGVLIELLKAHKKLIREHQKLKYNTMELTLKEFHVYYKEKNHEKKDNIQLWEINQAISEQYMSAKKLYLEYRAQIQEFHEHIKLVGKLSSKILSTYE
ncbi:hypothetical protein ACI65C_004013 [Semiaphis heraclei]